VPSGEVWVKDLTRWVRACLLLASLSGCSGFNSDHEHGFLACGADPLVVVENPLALKAF